MLTRIFGSQAGALLNISKDVLKGLNGRAIEWDESSFSQATSPAQFNKQYWLELLGRSYLASAASLMRFNVWLDALIACYEKNNYLGFAATLRGLVESSADSMFTLAKVPLTIAENYRSIYTAIHESDSTLILNEELEDALIHFSHARKVGKHEDAPSSHKALQNRDYIDTIKSFCPELELLYADLCELAHPASPSVEWMISYQSQKPWTVYFIGDSQSAFYINKLREKYHDTLPLLLMSGINFPIITLKTLSFFNVEDFKLDHINQIDVSNLPLWSKIKKALDNSRN